MSNYTSRATLGVLVILSLLAGFLALTPAPGDNGKAFAQSTDNPDLCVDSIFWWPEVPSIGDKITFTVTIRNIGDSWAGSSRLVLHIDDEISHSVFINGISPNTSTSQYFTWKAQAGEHIFKAVADHNEDIVESNETNNEKAYAFSVLAPDLIIDGITCSLENPSIGEEVTFAITTKNQGNKRAGCSNIGLNVDGNDSGYRPVPLLEAGDNYTLNYTWTASTGSHDFKFTADFLNQVKESDESNNQKEVTCITATPDLVIDSITWSPQNRSETSEVTFTVTVHNQGSGKADITLLAFYVDDALAESVYLGQISANTTTTKTFSRIMGANSHTFKAFADATEAVIESDESNNATEVTLPALAPDLIIYSITWSPTPALISHKTIFTITVKNQGLRQADFTGINIYVNDDDKYSNRLTAIPAGSTGAVTMPLITQDSSVTIRAVVDEDNYVVESNDSNNTMTKTVTFVAPSPITDLVVQGITCTPENPSNGDAVTITTNIKNQGSGQASPSHVAYYIDDILLENGYVNQINTGATVTNSIIWLATAGRHTIRAVIDCNNSVYETNETNNEISTVLSVPSPDLVIQSITWLPEVPSSGDAVTYTLNIKNQGDLKAGSSYVSYYIDDVYRGNHHIEDIGPGSSVTKTFTWTFETDSHTFKAIVDKANEVIESNESNNEKTVFIPTPDLTVELIAWSPAEPTENSTATFVITVNNIGDSTADSPYLDCYIDDILQKKIPLSSIASGATTAGSFTWSVQAGQHVFKAIIDGADSITEIDESNNEKTIPLPFPGELVEVIPESESPAEPAATNTPEPTEPEPDTIIETTIETSAENNDETGEAPPTDNTTDEEDIAENISDESPAGWKGILMNKLVIFGVAGLGLVLIAVLLVLKRRSKKS